MTSTMRTDPAWKYADEIEVPDSGKKKGYKYFKCKFCSQHITSGVRRVKNHLAGTHKDVKPCSKVPPDVKKEILTYLKAFDNTKHMKQLNFKEMVDSGSYYGSGGERTMHVGSHSVGCGTNAQTEDVGCGPSNSRGVRGPMDRYMVDENTTEAGKMTPAIAKEHRNQVCLDIGRFFYENGIPFNAARSASFVSMLRSVGNYGRGLKPPTMYELRTWILDEEEKSTAALVDEIKATWKKTGASLLSDGWSDMRNRSLINFLINNQYGTVFLRTVDASDCVKDAKKLFELLDEVGGEIGEDIVVQVITDNASAYKAAGALLMEKRKQLYWTPCAAHCIDLMLEKIGELPQHKNALLKAKKVSNFIYNHQWVLSKFREKAKKDLLRPAATRFSTAYLTLESMLELKQPLQSFFVSNVWANSAWGKKPEGKYVKNIVMDDNTFWPSVVYSIKTTKPLVDVLRMVDGERAPAMGFIYGSMDEAKEKIGKNFNGKLSQYKEIWDIIDKKWDNQMHRDLHAAAYYLNPRYRWSDNVSEHPEIKLGLCNCMERLIPDQEMFLKVETQLDAYRYKRGLFGMKAFVDTYKSRSPVTWWDNFGDEVPELKSFAMRILGLTCSALACERNWSTFNQVHTKRRNRLTTLKLNKLVYIMYNRNLKYKHVKKQSRKDEDDPLIVEDVPSDDEWLVNSDNENSEVEPTMPLLIDEGGSSGAPRKRKRNQSKGKGKNVRSELTLIDEDEEEEYDFEGDGGDGDGDGEDSNFLDI